MERWLKEPLLHFVLLGGLLFTAYAVLNRSSGSDPQVVHISTAEVEWLKQTWSRQWQRPPDELELRGLVTDYLKETLLAREALVLGLDENDIIVRRRLAQKMKFLVEDTARLAEPADAILREYYTEQRARYQTPAIISFNQRFFTDEASARMALQKLVQQPAADVGDRSLLQEHIELADGQTVMKIFGQQFAERVFELPEREWQGPISSGYGFHLVWIETKQAVRDQPFEQVRERVLEDWYRLEQERANAQFFAALLEKYDVVVDEDIRPLIGPLAEVSQ